MTLLKRLVFRTEGQDLIEYALLASLISVSVVLVLGPVGSNITTSYDEIESTLSSVADPGSGGGGPGNGTGNGNGRGGGNNSGSGNGGGRGNGGG
jgi:Flp pilus assembly pilin Flp